eukprot:Skav204488  [mRNA]  locus=scaffold535:238079:238300:- [translate_table: standard]
MTISSLFLGVICGLILVNADTQSTLDSPKTLDSLEIRRQWRIQVQTLLPGMGALVRSGEECLSSVDYGGDKWW